MGRDRITDSEEVDRAAVAESTVTVSYDDEDGVAAQIRRESQISGPA